MKLMTKELEERFKNYGLYSQEEKGSDTIVIAKYFNPYGAGTWFITEGEKQEDGDFLLFGLCHIVEWEWGYVRLSDLQDIGCIERDLNISKNTTVAEAIKAYGLSENDI